MDISDFEYLKHQLNFSGLFGSDNSLGNLFLLKDRYKIELERHTSYLLRKFDYSDSIRGYTFPIFFNEDASPNEDSVLRDYFLHITENQKKSNISLCLFTENQKKQFDTFITNNFPDYKIEWGTNPADGDYIYLQSDLENLPGKKLQKKKNHISKFHRTFANESFVYFNKSNFSTKIYTDFLMVADNWINEQTGKNSDSETHVYQSERTSIEAALNHISLFDFSGGLLYVEENPVAITLASKISDEVLDIHFEKCLSTEAAFGGYAVINNEFIKHCSNFKYINREEDLGIDGLRKAKLSYKPEIILDKYYGRLIKD